jgi:N-sulfoglucosamine sulfohydrolase
MSSSRRRFLQQAGTAAALSSVLQCAATAKEQPNVMWIYGEDMCADLGCYGTPLVSTPNLDRIAAEGARYTNCFTAAPVCSASRSGIITGMYQTSIDAHNHRSHRDDGYHLPPHVRLIPDYFRDMGYYCTNVRPVDYEYKAGGKTDWNFKLDHKVWDGVDWADRAPGQPFYAQVNFQEPHRGPAWARAAQQEERINPDDVELPAWYADHPAIREDYALYLDAVNLLDKYTGHVMQRLEEEGVLDNTILIFFGDNGRCMFRGKQFLYDSGIHVPMMVRWPGHIEPGTVVDDFVNTIDLGPTCLQLCGMEPPEHMEGQVFLGPDADAPREYIVAARDRCDETVDYMRCVRDDRYKYIKNYMPERPWSQPNNYKETSYPPYPLMRKMYEAGELTPGQAQFFLPEKPAEELFDIQADPNEFNNLANDPAHRQALELMRGRLDQWIAETGDRGQIPEKNIYLPKRG